MPHPALVLHDARGAKGADPALPLVGGGSRPGASASSFYSAEEARLDAFTAHRWVSSGC